VGTLSELWARSGIDGGKIGDCVKSSGGRGGGWSLLEEEYFAIGDEGGGVGSGMLDEAGRVR
jgi:hypothetical protein